MLTAVAEDIWAYEQDLRLPGLTLASRCTILRLGDGRLVIHSPLAVDDALAEAIARVGEPALLVAPSKIHFLFLERAMRRWPRARVLAAPGLEQKLPGLRYEPLPREGAPEAFAGELLVLRVDGFPYIGEHVFFHAKSRTLVCTDLVFNLHRASFLTSVFLRLVGAWKRVAQSLVWRLLARDRAAARASVAGIFSWDFDRVVMAHGEVIEHGRAELAKALRWLAPPLASEPMMRKSPHP